MSRCLLLLLCGMMLGTPAISGAWKRPQGEGFASASISLRRLEGSHSQELSYYGDFGITERFDLGVDLNQVDDLSGHALVFARLPLWQSPRWGQLATELALGGSHYKGHWRGMYRLTLSAGKNFNIPWGNNKRTDKRTGWGNIDLHYEQRSSQTDPLWKLDASFGLNTPGRISPVLSIETSKSASQAFSYTIIPALRIKLADLKLFNSPAKPRARPGEAPLGRQASDAGLFDQSDLLIGLSYRQADTQSLGLKISLWHRF